jgi:hypothetical protein
MIGLVASLLTKLTEMRGAAIFASAVAAGRSSALAREGNSFPRKLDAAPVIADPFLAHERVLVRQASGGAPTSIHLCLPRMCGSSCTGGWSPGGF